MELEDQPWVEGLATTVDEGDGPAGPLLQLDVGPALEWSTDRRLRLTWARGTRCFDDGLAPEDLVGKRVTEAFGRIELGAGPAVAHVRALDGESVRCRIRCGMRILEAEIRPRRNAEGYVIGAAGVATDVDGLDRPSLREAMGPAAPLPPRRGRTGAVVVRTP